MTKQTARHQGRIILAFGEVTGHMHEVLTAEALAVPDESQAMFFTHDDGTRELVLLAPCVLRHDEHAPIALDPSHPQQVRQGDVLLQPLGPGAWRVIQQREGYSPESWRAVAD